MRSICAAVFVSILAACKGPGDPSASDAPETSTTGEPGAETETGEDTPGCSAQTPAELMDCVERERFEDDLELVSEQRVPGSDHWQAVQDECAERLDALGYAVERESYGTGVNVVGRRPGTDAADEWVIVGAHYDHITNCSGADDNGSGLAALFEIARILADIPTSRTLVITCWDEEELGLIGSAAQAQAAVDAGQAIAGVVCLDSIGVASSEPNSQVVPDGFDLLFPDQYGELVANEYRADFLLWVADDAMLPIGESLDGFGESLGLRTLGAGLDDGLKNSPLLADLRRSDHASFWAVDIPALFLNDTANFRYGSYHCIDGEDDSVDKVDLEFAVRVTKVAVASVALALGM